MVAMYTPAVKGLRGMSSSLRAALTLWPTSCCAKSKACERQAANAKDRKLLKTEEHANHKKDLTFIKNQDECSKEKLTVVVHSQL